MPGIITLKTTLPEAKTKFDEFFNNLFDKDKFDSNDGVLIFNNICVDFEIAEDLITIMKGLKEVVFKKILITNTEAISIYNILYILLYSRLKYEFLVIDNVVDSNKANLDNEKKRNERIKKNKK